MAYKVYYGRLTTPDEDHNLYNWISRTLVYDSANTMNDKTLMLNPVLTRKARESGSFEADIPPSNICYSSLRIMLGVFEIERDSEILWQGRITQIDYDFQKNAHVYVEGDMAYLNDNHEQINWDFISGWSSNYPAVLFTNYAMLLIDSNGKTITPKINSYDPNWETVFKYIEGNDPGYNDSAYMTQWDIIQNTLLNRALENIKEYVYFKMSHTRKSNGWQREIEMIISNPANPSNFLIGSLPTTSQTIEFGKNLLDINVSKHVNDIVTHATVYGYETRGWWIFSTTNMISATATNSTMLQKYGYIHRSSYVDGNKSTVSSLQEIANSMVFKNVNDEISEVTVNAVDLADAGEAKDHIDFLKVTKVVSEPHGLNEYMICTELVEPLDNPAGKEFTFGRTRSSMTISQSYDNSTSNRAYGMGYAAKDYLNKTNSN